MDTFVRRGLNDFYCGTDPKDNVLTNNTVASGATEHQYTKNRKIVGGITFTRRLNASAQSAQDSAAAIVTLCLC